MQNTFYLQKSLDFHLSLGKYFQIHMEKHIKLYKKLHSLVNFREISVFGIKNDFDFVFEIICVFFPFIPYSEFLQTAIILSAAPLAPEHFLNPIAIFWAFSL